MEPSRLALIELNSTLGHLSWSIREVSTDGALLPILCQWDLIQGTDGLSWPHPGPSGVHSPA